MVKRIAVIPARGGSKRIPHKNIIDFCGKPMLAWTIEAAKGSGLFDRVLVSTDDPSIADIGKQWGAEVPFLRQGHYDDHATVSEATIAALAQAQHHWGETYDIVVQLMANCPNRDAGDIQRALKSFEDSDTNFQISCFKFGWMNPWWSVKLDQTGQPQPLFPEAVKCRSQDLADLYCPTGAIWVASAPALLRGGSFYGERHRFEPMSWTSAVDIDDYADIDFARLAFELKYPLTRSAVPGSYEA